FIALDIPVEIRDRLSQYVDRIRRLAPDARWARIESLHVTLKFIGEVPDAKVQEIQTALATVKARPFDVVFKDIGFFPTPRSARVFWAGVNASDALPQLASAVEDAVEKLGIPREKRAYHAHLTLARAPEGSASKHCFRLLQEKLSAEEPPQFGTMSAQEFFLYRSQIMRGGARYTKLQRFPLE
ncbi:MAG TPA: RNA 2',3'-cyclic phosphodiesterase, partial [Candidatus Angelobacter sp.]